MSGENLDITSEPEDSGQAARLAAEGGRGQPFIGIQFACCQSYARVYLNADGTAYEGRCPRCGRKVEARIGPDGRDERFFTVW